MADLSAWSDVFENRSVCYNYGYDIPDCADIRIQRAGNLFCKTPVRGYEIKGFAEKAEGGKHVRSKEFDKAVWRKGSC